VSASGRRRLDVCAAILLALFVTTIGLIWGTRVAAGADAYGYVSQVDLWLRGNLHIDQSFGARVPWPLARWTFVPLGYRPEPDGYRIVPQYPAGLPLLMAAAKLVAGQCALFWVVPICGGVLVAATYLAGRRLGDADAAVAAAWLVATSPTVLFMTIAPMSDVPAAAAWSVAIACALRGTRAAGAGAGAAAALAIVIRPNLAPLAIVIGLWLAKWGRGAAIFVAIAAVGAVVVAAINTRLYGSPLSSGYDLTDGFALSYVPTNLGRYGGWLLSAETGLAIAGLIGLAIPWRALWPVETRAVRTLFAACALVVVGFYLLYVPWDAWWYLRFLLPAWPLLAIAGGRLLMQVGRRGPAGRAMAAALVLALGCHGLWQAYRRETFNAARGESKYVEVARAVEAIADPDAVIISAQHSGSIRYYAGRLTLRWDTGDPAWLDRTVEWLANNGHHPYFVLEPQEIDVLRAQYGAQNASARLDWTPMVVFRRGGVTMFDAVRRVRTGSPVEQPELRGVRECVPQRPFPAMR